MKINRETIKNFFVNLPKNSLIILKKYWVYLVLIAALLAFDLISKHLTEQINKVVIPNFLRFYYHENDGASFGMLKGQQTLFLIITPIALIFFFAILFTADKYKPLYKISLAMIIAGTIGNYVDRLAFGFVRDFIQIIFFGLDLPILGRDFAIFNIADSCLVVGMIIFAVYTIIIFFNEEKQQKNKENNTENDEKIQQNN